MARKRGARRTKTAKTLESPTRMLVLRLPRDLVAELDAVVKELQEEIPIVEFTASQILEHVVARRLIGLHEKQERVRVVADVQQELRARVRQPEWWRQAVARAGR